MKKISTLALALIAMGTVTSAWATSTDNLPTGYYKIKSAVTGNSNITNIHMFNDAFLQVNTPKTTLLSAETAETNNYIWYVTNTGGSKISIVNGQGTGIKIENGNKGSYSYKGPHKELTPVDANSTYPTSIYFSEGLYTPNTSGAQSTNHQYGSYTAVAYWNAPNQATTKWNFESVSVEDKGVYTVTVTGSADGYVTRTATSEHAFNGGFFIAESGSTISADDLTAGAVEGFTSNVSVNASTKTITVTYAADFTTWTGNLNEAKAVLTSKRIGYPVESSTAYATFKSTLDELSKVTAENLTSAKFTELATAVSAFKLSTDNIRMPEDGKAYTITAVSKAGVKSYMNYAASGYTLKKTDAADNSSYPETAKFVCHKVEDGKYVFVNNDGKFLTYKGGYNAAVNGNKGYTDGYTKVEYSYTDKAGASQTTSFYPQLFTLPKLANGSNASGVDDAYLCLLGQRANNNNAANDVYYVIKGNSNFDGGSAPYFNDTYSSAFLFEEVSYPNTVTFNKVSDVEGVSNLATFSAPFATVVPEGVTAYYVETTDRDNSTATMKAIEAGKAIPANAGVILTSTTGDEATMIPATTETAADLTGNKLGNSAGADKTIAADDHAYILSAVDGQTAFYKGKVGTTLGMNKAYLTLDAAGTGEAISMNFGGNVTGINQIVNAEQNNAPVYDFTGRRVVRTVKGGLYIKGGNKFIAR